MLNLRNEAARCLLCALPACTSACTNGCDPAAMLRAIRFENEKAAARYIIPEECGNCSAPCESACIHPDMPIRILEAAALFPEKTPKPDYKNLETEFMGVKCENPFFLSSSVVAGSYEMCARALEAGWGGIVYKTIGLFTPDEVSPRFDAVGKENTPFVGFRNLEQISDHPYEENFEAIRRLKKDYPTKVIVSSIMGRTEEEWTELARLSEEAGADMIECNFSCPQMAGPGMGSDVGQSPELVKRYTEMTKLGTKLPVMAKMTPNLGDMTVPAMAALDGGADGIAAINTIKSISSLDLESLAVLPAVSGKSAVSGYSGKAVKPIALRFIADMAKCPGLKCMPLSGMGGIETWRDAAEFIALGCGNIQITTAVMQYGYRIIDDLKSGLSDFLKDNGYKNVDNLRGRALSQLVPADNLDRNTVIYPVFDRNKCLGCGRCYISCADGGHQAIGFEGRTPKLIGKNCVGCHLCRLVCPSGAIGTGNRVDKPKK
ncbi:MAG: NAD-dependent dihydropyrimidine dehydrogenase subunit PreA [Ruminiclostridium sp.]